MAFSAAPVVLALMLGWGAPHLQQDARTFNVERKDQGFLLTDRYPTSDFQIELKINISQGGTLLDTVGIDAAPKGSWNIMVAPDGKVAFQLWDGSAWSNVTCQDPLKFGEDTMVMVRRAGGPVTVRVGSAWSRRSLATPLSGKPVYVGDYPPDAHWGSQYNINQGAPGRIEVLYVGEPMVCPANFSDFSLRVVDQQNITSAGERTLLAQLLERVKAKRGIDVAVAFVDAGDLETGTLKTGEVSHRLYAKGVLPDTFAMLVAIGKEHRMFHRSQGADAKLSWDDVRNAWERPPDTDSLPVRYIKALAELADYQLGSLPEPGTKPNVRPVDTSPTTLPATGPSTKTSISEAGGKATNGAIAVEIPAGAIAKPGNLVIQQGKPTPFGTAGCSIEWEGTDQILLEPATITYPIPQGANPNRLAAFRSIGPRLWVSMPTKVNAATGQATATTNHFCDSVLLDYGRFNVQSLSGVGTAGAVTIVLALVGSAPVSSAGALAVAIPTFAAGWFAGGAMYDAAQKEGLVGPLPTTGFEIYWDPKKVPAGPVVYGIVDKRNGHLIALTKDSRDDPSKNPPTIGPATGAPRQTMKYTYEGEVVEVGFSDVKDIAVPVSILTVAGDLTRARMYYESIGLACPPTTTVYCYDRVGKSPDQEKKTNSGLWDGRVLGINAASLNPEPPNSSDSRSATCHEYFHAVVSHNGWKEWWPGEEEGTAVALESLVWASPQDAHEDELMSDFLTLHGWTTCSPVLRTGLFIVGPDESADNRGYKQWPLLKYILHKHGPDKVAELFTRKTTREQLDQMIQEFALACVVSETTLEDVQPVKHPIVNGAVAKTGFKDRNLIQDQAATSIKFGENQAPQAAPGSVRAYRISLPARSAATPQSPIVARRKRVDSEATPIIEKLWLSKPVDSPLPTPNRASLKEGTGAVALPAEWDADKGQILLLSVGSLSAANLSVATARDGSINNSIPMLVYRLAPPTNVKATHDPAVSDEKATSTFSWTLPDLGGGLKPTGIVGSYKLYGRKAGGQATLLKEFSIKNPQAPPGWHPGSNGAVEIDGDVSVLSFAIARSLVVGFDEFAMSSVDGLAKVGGAPLESPIGWGGATDLLEAFSKCTSVSLLAAHNFEGSTTVTRGTDPPQVTTESYPKSGVNPPDTWGLGSDGLKGSKLVCEKSGKFTLTFTGKPNAGGKGPGDLLGTIRAHNPYWPFSAGGGLPGDVEVKLSGQIQSDGKLVSCDLSVVHPSYGCAMHFGDVLPGTVITEGGKIAIEYNLKEADATAKTSGVSTWMLWTYNGGSTEFRLTKYTGTRTIVLHFGN